MLQKLIFSYVRAIFFVFMYTVSTVENNSRDTVLKTLFLVFSNFLSIFEILHVFLLYVERDEFGLKRRKASFANPVFTPFSI